MVLATVAYPVPILLVPRRGHLPRIEHDRRPMEVALPEADPSEFHPIGFAAPGPVGRDGIGRRISDETGCRLYDRGGTTWHRLVRSGTDDDLPLDRLLAYLSGHDGGRGSWLNDHFARTPLVAAWDYRADGLLSTSRGTDAAIRGGHVLDDPGAAVAAGVGDLLRDGLAIAGESVFVRIGSPAAIQSGYVEPPDSRVTFFPRSRARLGNFCRIDDLRRFLTIQGRHGLVDLDPGPVALHGTEDPAAFPAHLLDDADLTLFACCLSEALHRFAARIGGVCSDVAAAVSRAALLGRVGLVPGGDLPASLLSLRAHLDTVRERSPRAPRALGFARDFIEEIALPRLAPRLDADLGSDGADLAGLAPH